MVAREEDPLRKQVFEETLKYCKAESDLIRLELRFAPKYELTRELISEEARKEPLTWRDKLTSFLRKALGVGTVLSILGGGISLVFSALSYFHEGVKKARHGLNKDAESAGKLLEKVGPVLIPSWQHLPQLLLQHPPFLALWRTM